MIVIYDKTAEKFHLYKDMKGVVTDFGIPYGVVQGAQELTIDTGGYIIGVGEEVKSNRGGKR